MATIKKDEFVVEYNSKDLILYALSLGFGSAEQDLQYLYEDHARFRGFPTFSFALSFWASQTISSPATSYAIQDFPPPSMALTSTIPLKLRQSDALSNKSNYPILHMWQSIIYHKPLPVPKSKQNTIKTRLKCRILQVIPKSIGTFVTSETKILYCNNGKKSLEEVLLCTLQSTTLVLGFPKESVRGMLPPKDSSVPRPNSLAKQLAKKRPPDHQWTYQTTPTQALLYRLASGDSNKIHVIGDPTMMKALGISKEKPILHGLCTLGIAARGILQCLGNNYESFHILEGSFAKPVFLGDQLRVRLWSVSSANDHVKRIAFVVVNVTTGNEVITNGYVELTITNDAAETSRRGRSRL